MANIESTNKFISLGLETGNVYCEYYNITDK